MKTLKAEKRDKKRNKRKYGQRVSGKSVFLIQQCQAKRATVILEKKNKKEKKNG